MTGTTATSEVLHRATVDDYLGPGERRFFGGGYRRAEQRLADIRLTPGPDGGGTGSARASVGYPQDWSRKGDADRVPHLSSVDVLLIAGEMAELHLTHALGLDLRQRGELRLRRVRIQAGTNPVEKELADFQVHAAATPQTERTTLVHCRVGALRVRCEVEHPPRPAVPTVAPAHHHHPDALLGPARLRPFAAAHRTKTQLVEDLRVDLAAGRATALVSTRSTAPAGLPVQGLESYSHGATSILDAFVAGIQLGQILLYGLDSVSRAESDTLWMRQAVLEIGDPYRPVRRAELAVRLAEPRLLTTRSGETWRTVDVVGELEHLGFRCSATHRLPGGAS
ncbi:AvrD family protein [Kitasatospora sp. NPDC052896]|uniref:AvrD family protein n=1 Tax=Kitasatospora sp. NPDC052896 TaxID=3364061 RepID=UPI0037CB047F